MDKSKENKLMDLTQFLRKTAKKRQRVAAESTDYHKGLLEGYADGYELCAKWIEEILQGGHTNEND